MLRRRANLWALLTVLLLATALVGYFLVTERVRYMAPAALDASVRNNPYLAAQTLLEEWQRPTRRIFSTTALFPLPSTDTTLIVDEYRGELGSDRIEALFTWVQQGGHLIVAARPASHYRSQEAKGNSDNKAEGSAHNDDPLLSPLAIRAVAVTSEKTDDDPFNTLLDRVQPMEVLFLEYCLGEDARQEGDLSPQCLALTCEAPPLPAPASFDDDTRRFLLAAPGQALRHEATERQPGLPLLTADNQQGAQLLQLPQGTGRITVLAGLTLWDNQHLHYFDHAWLLKTLTGDGPVWFIQGINMPPLPLWLWEHAWPLIFALLLAFAVWLWRRLPRIGPPRQATDTGRADYLSHLLALGHFHWRTQQSEALLRPLLRSAERRLDLLHRDREQALTIAANRLAISETTLRDALKAHPNERSRDRQQWTHRVAILQTLRSRL